MEKPISTHSGHTVLLEFFDTSIVEQIELKMIRASQFAIRDRFRKTANEDDTLLSNSMREHGLLQPILVRPLTHGFEIVAGHRRFQACRSLRWRFISCKIRDMSDKQAYEIQLTENMQRKSMDPVEEAEAFRRYVIDLGWGGVTELAKKIGKSEEYVSHRLQLLKLPDDIKEKIISTRLNVSQAMELTTIPPDKQSQIIDQVINNNLTVKQIRQVKSVLKEEYDFEGLAYDPKNLPKSVRTVRITKKTCLALRITLARLDNLIDEVHVTIEAGQRAEIINFLMGIRLKTHNLIDETIRFKNTTIKSMKN
ncbi:MAG: ParB/RepB/Spo0J family partition protein [Thermoproteota archaeon]|nr:ParB/RepB/Spo0J family partition protein [Thermoproteota archaeon]